MTELRFTETMFVQLLHAAKGDVEQFMWLVPDIDRTSETRRIATDIARRYYRRKIERT